ncbi:hypothetical protein, partial [Escherichia coli]|uniref:hypothetical protein n=7 Tax=Escherichia coli TaxID=562 RepID=UPI001A7E0930
ITIDDCWEGWVISLRQKQKKLIMLPSETMIWQPEFTDKTLSRKTGAVQSEFDSVTRMAANSTLYKLRMSRMLFLTYFNFSGVSKVEGILITSTHLSADSLVQYTTKDVTLGAALTPSILIFYILF